jgi:hypothetical protein
LIIAVIRNHLRQDRAAGSAAGSGLTFRHGLIFSAKIGISERDKSAHAVRQLFYAVAVYEVGLALDFGGFRRLTTVASS